jgi:hypothetical protein
MYHSIGGRDLSPEVVVSWPHFRAHLAYVRRHYTPRSLEDAVAHLEQGQVMPTGSIVVTFDDGYRDSYEAARFSEQVGRPPTVFVTVEPVATDRPLWPIVLLRLLDGARRPEWPVSWRGAGGGAIDTVLPLRTEDERARARFQMLTFAGGLETADRDDFLRTMADTAAPAGPGGNADGPAMLSWDQIREMRDRGIGIESHTMTHPRLPGVGPETVRHELAESRRILEEELGTSVRFLAYPFGWFDQDTERAVASTGYEAAFTATLGDANGPVDLFALDRLYIPDEPVWTFAVRLLGLEVRSRLLAWIVRTP